MISNPPGEGGDIGIPGPGTFIGMTIVAFGFENGFYLFRDLCVCDRRNTTIITSDVILRNFFINRVNNVWYLFS
jgi:hypothetical protein